MFKQCISTLLILSLLFPDIAWCGGLFTNEKPEQIDDRDDLKRTPVKLQAADEKTPLKRNSQLIPFPLSIENERNQTQSLSLPNLNGPQSFTDESTEVPLFSETLSPEDTDFEGAALNLPKGKIAGLNRVPSLQPSNEDEADVRSTGGLEVVEDSEEEPEKVEEAGKTTLQNDEIPVHQNQTGEGQPIWQQAPPEQMREKRKTTSIRNSTQAGEENSDRSQRSPLSLAPFNIQASGEELGDFVVVTVDLSNFSIDDLSPPTKEFLRYLKKRIVNSELNKKQKAGIVVGLATGAGVAWPLMLIFYAGLCEFYSNQLFNQISIPCDNIENPMTWHRFIELMQNFNKVLNLYTMTAFVGLPSGIDAASRTAFILKEWTSDSTQSFSRQKSQNRERILLFTKGGLGFCVFLAGALPVYYLHENQLDTEHSRNDVFAFAAYGGNNPGAYVFSNNIHFNLNITNCTCTTIENCFSNFTSVCMENFYDSPRPLSNVIIFWAGGSCLLFDTAIQYGHQLFEAAKGRINAYYFQQMAEAQATEVKRRGYLNQFKDLKRMIDGLEDEGVGDLYDEIMAKDLRKAKQDAIFNPEELTLKEALRVLHILQDFHQLHVSTLKVEKVAAWKKKWSERLGWGITLTATTGRTLIFWNVIYDLLQHLGPKTLSYEAYEALSEAASFVLGGVVANLTQGFIEKDAVKKGVYEILRGEKVPDGSSHKPFRYGIKTWDYLYGAFNTLPYLITGITLLDSDVAQCYYLWYWQLRIPFLISFGLADAFNNAIAFHHSNFKAVNAVDSALSYVKEPSPEVKKDFLIRIVRHIRKLYKDLDGNVLEEVDQQLQRLNQRASHPLLIDESDSI